jgi:hypothetical protein
MGALLGRRRLRLASPNQYDQYVLYGIVSFERPKP